MRGSHVLVVFLASAWMCCPPACVQQPERIIYVPVHSFGLERARPTNVELKETIGDSLTVLEGVGIFSRYSGQRMGEKLLFPATQSQPQMLYVQPFEGSVVWHGYPAPNVQLCVEPTPTSVAER